MNAETRAEIRRSGLVAFRHRSFTFYWIARVLSRGGTDMQATVVGWQVYNLTGQPLDLGLVGLAQVAPFFLLFAIAGIAADRYPRARVLSLCISFEAAVALGFFILTVTEQITFPLIIALITAFGIARAFQVPADQAMTPILVPKDHFANAVAWASAGAQVARVAGPGIAGLMIISSEGLVYGSVAVLMAAATIAALMIRANTQILSREPVSLTTLLAGIRFIFSHQVVLAVITIDLFAVLLGGAVALLPIYAKDILVVGPAGFGTLRAVITAGAFAGAIYFTQRPLRRHAGPAMLGTVAIFGLATVVFGLSTNFWLSLIALFIVGTSDSVSAFIRNNVVQIITPDDVRGRVNAVNSVFIGASNQVGEFESGITAHWWGTVPAVIVGGVGTILVAIAAAWIFPQLRRMDSLDPDELVRRYRHGEAVA